MPIGVPQVLYEFSDDDYDDDYDYDAEEEDEDDEWVDVYTRLYQEGVLFIADEIDSELSNEIISAMLYLNMVDPTQDQYVFINSPGGSILYGMGIYDTMEFVSADADVHTICFGVARSMASLLLVGGVENKRMAFPHARVMIHQPAVSRIVARSKRLLREVEFLKSLKRDIIAEYVERTGQPLWVIERDIERDHFMSAREAKGYGIVDEIVDEFPTLEFDEFYEI
uniref:ATP-dependent Clp protease proteolytic subunit n=1 Tax=Chrysojasminum fruticans TaxID=310424 RepID=UPI001BEDE19B|nr:ATP-dependent Clp protease proteolytic subunit [Chrysojasminum fruticans]QIV67374.1 ATP-dependent Clp protease proteolytic subunit [Chrysojasminum fruticans]